MALRSGFVAGFICFVFGWGVSGHVFADTTVGTRSIGQPDAALWQARVVSVLPVLAPGQAPSPREPEGSGIVVGGGSRVVTAAHVLKGAVGYRVRTVDGTVLPAKLIGRDPATDIALLSVDRKLTGFDLATASHDVGLGTRACALGNAFGLGVSMTCGVVSAVNVSQAGFNPIEDFVQTDASVNPGMSGGALVDSSGRLIGMLSAIFTKTSDANIGINFAVSVPLLRRVVSDLQTYGRMKRVASGLILQNGLARGAIGRPGARVVRIRPQTSAARAGFEPGDLVVAVRSGQRHRQIRKAADFVSFTATLPLPYAARVRVVRNGTEQDIEMKVGE